MPGMRIIKRGLGILVVVVVVVLLAKHFLLDTAATPSGTFAIDLAALHRAAVNGGPLPARIEVEKIGTFGFPQTFVVAGGGFRMHPMVLLAHRVVWPDHSLIIDTAMAPEAAKKMPGGQMDGAAYARLQEAMKRAETILFTHEHPDHVGGAAKAPDFTAIAGKIRMTREQLAGPKLDRDDFPPHALDSLKPLDYRDLYAVAPGVVLQKAPGHSTGSQLVYVELASGARFLFVGDIAWSGDNIRQQTGRPGVATLLMKEDRAAVAAQLQAFGALPATVHVIMAHDPVALERDLAAGLYRQGFSAL
jgi:glyoxylase-like metal-dependent hydrolase (beta-lactamase superfamily II)